MIVTIWRHGEAEEGVIDHQRELTGRGRDDLGFGRHQFHDACSVRNVQRPHRILHSPLRRTAQTAEVLASAFTHAAVTEVEALRPGSETTSVNTVLTQLAEAGSSEEHLILVSHQPLVSRLVDYYLGAPGSVPPLPPGGLVTLSLDIPAPGCGALLFWAFPPEYEACT